MMTVHLPPPLAGPHDALLAAIARGDAHAVTSLLAAHGPNGSDDALSLLALHGHAALLAAVDRCAAFDAFGAPTADGWPARTLKAVLRGFGWPGSAETLAALAHFDAPGRQSYLLAGAALLGTADALDTLIDAYGGPGSAGAVAALAAGGHRVLGDFITSACVVGVWGAHFEGKLSSIFSAYGEVDGATPLAVLGGWLTATPPCTKIRRNSRLALLMARTGEAWPVDGPAPKRQTPVRPPPQARLYNSEQQFEKEAARAAKWPGQLAALQLLHRQRR